MKIFVNSLPKSGTNLVAKLIEGLGYKYSNKSIALSSKLGRYERIKRLTRSRWFRGGSIEIGLEINADLSSAWVEKYLTQVQDGQYVTGHAAYSDHLNEILINNGYKIIQVIRNPLDVMFSYAKYIIEKENRYYPTHATLASLTLNERVKLLAKGGRLSDCDYYLRGIREVLRSQEGWFQNQTALPIRFEDLVGPKGGGTQDAQKNIVKEICSYIEVDEKKGLELIDSLYGGTHTFRSGKIGSASESLDAETRKLVMQKLHGNRLVSDLGYINEV